MSRVADVGMYEAVETKQRITGYAQYCTLLLSGTEHKIIFDITHYVHLQLSVSLPPQ